MVRVFMIGQPPECGSAGALCGRRHTAKLGVPAPGGVVTAVTDPGLNVLRDNRSSP